MENSMWYIFTCFMGTIGKSPVGLLLVGRSNNGRVGEAVIVGDGVRV